MSNIPPTEAEIRAMRDRVYGHPISDTEWKVCGPYWMSPEGIHFLKCRDFPIGKSGAKSVQDPVLARKSC